MSDKNETFNFKCKEEGCSGEVDLGNYTTVKTGCHSCSVAYACNTCKRLHFKNDEAKEFDPVSNRQDQKAFLSENGSIDLRS